MEMDDTQSLRLLIADCKRLVNSLSKLEKEMLKEYQKQKKGKNVYPFADDDNYDWENEILNG
jgi:hypothetical protein